MGINLHCLLSFESIQASIICDLSTNVMVCKGLFGNRDQGVGYRSLNLRAVRSDCRILVENDPHMA